MARTRPIMRLLPALLIGAASTVVAQSPQPPAPLPQTSSTSEENPNKKICRSYDVTGSRVSKRRICFTAAEWAERDEAGRRDAGNAIDRNKCLGEGCRGGF